MDDPDIVVAEPRHPRRRQLGQLGMALDRDHRAGDPAHHRGGIARAGADLEHRVAGRDRRPPRSSARRYRAGRWSAGLDRQRRIVIGMRRSASEHERFARHRRAAPPADAGSRDAAPVDLPRDHRLACGGEIGHVHLRLVRKPAAQPQRSRTAREHTPAVIPANAGHPACFRPADRSESLDSRMRGNDEENRDGPRPASRPRSEWSGVLGSALLVLALVLLELVAPPPPWSSLAKSCWDCWPFVAIVLATLLALVARNPRPAAACRRRPILPACLGPGPGPADPSRPVDRKPASRRPSRPGRICPDPGPCYSRP